MSVIWKDGTFLDATLNHVSADDAGFVNGLGIFDSMLAKDGVLIDALEHFERILHDAEAVIGMGAAWLPGFAGMTEPLLSQNHLTDGYARVKTIVTGGISQGPLKISKVPSIVVTVAPTSDPAKAKPLTCAIVREHPRVAGDALEICKRLDYTRNFAARRKAQARGADEAIMTNTDGNIACAATSNIFIREGARMITPPLHDGVLAGITRRKILEGATVLTKPVAQGGRGMIAVEESISEERLRKADELFVTNSFVGLRKINLLT
jgi:branched-chain amino acid aminotransferase